MDALDEVRAERDRLRDVVGEIESEFPEIVMEAQAAVRERGVRDDHP